MRLKPKKRLGQSFLTDKNIQKKIVEACELKSDDYVLEIGAGSGELTGLIAQKAKKVYALEIDPNLCNLLRNNLKDNLNLEIINQDILKFNFRKYFSSRNEKIKVIGNIPYYISSPIIEYLFRFLDRIDSIFITVQKEFARRIEARAGREGYGAFSCFVQYYTQPKIMLSVKKTCFFPVPKVDSSLVRLKVLAEPRVRPVSEELFFKIIRACFGQRRKTLRNSLSGIIPAEKLESFFTKYAIDRNIRPEGLTLEDFANLTNS